MNQFRIRLTCTLLVLAGAALAQPGNPLPQEEWQPGRLISARQLENWSAAQVQAQSGRAFVQYGQPIIENGVELWELSIVTTGLGDELVPITAQLFVPVEAPRETAPLFVYGSGTTGLAAQCAPSRETLLPTPLGYYRELLAAYAGRGFVTVFPDYLGFDDPDRPQSYFHAQSEAHVLLDSARAVREFFELTGRSAELLPDTFFGGYSQGGHAAFAVADRHLEYAPDVLLRGVIGFAATTDVEALMREAAFYSPYIVLSYLDAYGPVQVDPSEILAARWLPGLESNAGSVCVDRAQQIYPMDGAELYTSEFHTALMAGNVASAAPGFATALTANRTGLSGHGVPALVIQGGRDVIVSDAVQETFVAELCTAGSPVQYVNHPTARHRDTRPAGFEQSLLWMRSLLEPGSVPPSDC